jgi:hypothetical protein
MKWVLLFNGTKGVAQQLNVFGQLGVFCDPVD